MVLVIFNSMLKTKRTFQFFYNFGFYFDTHPLGKDGHLDAVVGPLLSEREHLLLGVVQEGGGASPAAVVKVRYHDDLSLNANNVFYVHAHFYHLNTILSRISEVVFKSPLGKAECYYGIRNNYSNGNEMCL